MQRVIAVLVATTMALVSGSGAAEAGVLSTHAFAGGVTSQGGPFRGASFGAWDAAVGDTAASVSVGDSGLPPNGVADASATAQVGVSANALMQFSASALNDIGVAQTAWRDVVFLNSSAQPAKIRLEFQIDSRLSLPSSPGAGEARVSFIPITGDTVRDYFGTTIVHLQGNQTAEVPNAGGLLTSNTPADTNSGPFVSLSTVRDFVISDGLPPALPFWDSHMFNSGDGDFEGRFHLDVPFSSALGGYAWALNVLALANGQPVGAASVDPPLVGLHAVTLPDGTPLGGVTFDSGLQLGPAPVPEPSSLVLVAISAAGVALGRVRRFVAR